MLLGFLFLVPQEKFPVRGRVLLQGVVNGKGFSDDLSQGCRFGSPLKLLQLVFCPFGQFQIKSVFFHYSFLMGTSQSSPFSGRPHSVSVIVPHIPFFRESDKSPFETSSPL